MWQKVRHLVELSANGILIFDDTVLNYTCTHLAAHLPEVSHDQANRFLRDSSFSSSQLRELVAPLLNDSLEAFLLVDDGCNSNLRFGCSEQHHDGGELLITDDLAQANEVIAAAGGPALAAAFHSLL